MPLENSNFSTADSDPTPVTIFVHIFHIEVWPEILAHLDRLTFPYQIVITSPHPRAAIRLPDNAVEIEFHQTANMGRDIGPFLTSLRETHLATDICLKLHTKRSLHRPDGDIWRRSILADLLADPDSANRTVGLLRENPKIGLVSPNRHLVPIGLFLGANEARIRSLLEVYGIDAAATDLSKALFVAGSMFWFRSAAFPLLRSRSSAIEFDRERGQLDGTIAHAHERIFAALAEHSGFIGVTIDELTQRDDPAYRALPALERAKRDADLFSKAREPLGISAFLNPSRRQTDGVRRALQFYRKFPVGIRRFIRRTLRMPQ
jgi:lipopolysaccharide biosynthesis protein